MSITESQSLEQSLCQVLNSVPESSTTVTAGIPDPHRSTTAGAFLQLLRLDEAGKCRSPHPVFLLTILQRDRLTAWEFPRLLAAWLPRRNVTGTSGNSSVLFREIFLCKEDSSYVTERGERLFRIRLELQTVL